MNHGEIYGKSTAATSGPSFPVTALSRGESVDGKQESDVDGRGRDGRGDAYGVPSGEGEMMATEKEKVGGENGSAGNDEALGPRVSGDGDREARASEDPRCCEVELSGKIGFSGSEVSTDDGIVSAERELGTFDCDSPSMDSSESSGRIGGWMHGFEMGDMVWGKVKSHPWWPGHIYNDEFASPPVRRTKKEGHVLVAFFGDNSYGWFDPAELIPFERYFVEKSRQTNSRNFVKAVEEATDEIGRRRALGLSCFCVNPLNFRPTSVPGYFSVEVVNSEFVGVYSTKQIKKARDGFVPVGVISFVKQLAVVPRDPERGTVDWINNMALLLALRRTRFEEFDETYAQAFGVEPIRPSRDAIGVLEQPFNLATRAPPLSGPLVFAETLGVKRKTAGKYTVRSSKDKTKAKKDKYLFKRRDDAPARVSVASAGPEPLVSPSIISAPTSFREGRRDATPGRLETSDPSRTSAGGHQLDEYVLQRRAPSDFVPGSVALFPSDIKPAVSDSVGGSVKVGTEAIPVLPPRSDVVKAEAPVSDDGSRVYLQLEGRKPGFDGRDGVGIFVQKPAMPTLAVDQDNAIKDHPSGAVVKKEKKRHLKEDDRPELLDAEGKKKKRKRKKEEAGLGTRADRPLLSYPKIEIDGEPSGKSAENSVGIGLPISDSILRETKNELGIGWPLDVAVRLPALDFKPQELDIPLLASDLLALALDPFHGSDRDASLLVRFVLLRFRSLVYQKSLVPLSSNEYDSTRLQDRKSEIVAARPGVNAPTEAEERERTQMPSSISKELRHTTKTMGRPHDPTKSGRKRPPSERQEEKSVRKAKKLKQLKLLASEKKPGASQKPTEGNVQDVAKETATAQAKALKTDLSKKQDPAPPNKKQEALRLPKKQEPVPPPPKVLSPTFLFMKFPPRSTLPSIASMKVKFGRFGPLDLSGARVYWGSYTCKLLFKYRVDAQAAYMYARSNDVFGPVKVNYSLRDSEVQEPAKRDADDTLQSKSGRSDDTISDMRPPALKSQRQQQAGQLKSCLKKPPSNDDMGPAGSNNLKETLRVKFMLDGEGGRRESPVVTGGGSGSSSSLPPMDPNGNSSRSVNFVSQQPPLPSLPINPHMMNLPPRPPLTPQMHPLAPPPPRLSVGEEHGPPPHFGRHNQVVQHEEGKDGRGIGGVDISYEMLNLLRRCSEIVTNVRTSLGYVPYHSL